MGILKELGEFLEIDVDRSDPLGDLVPEDAKYLAQTVIYTDRFGGNGHEAVDWEHFQQFANSCKGVLQVDPKWHSLSYMYYQHRVSMRNGRGPLLERAEIDAQLEKIRESDKPGLYDHNIGRTLKEMFLPRRIFPRLVEAPVFIEAEEL